MKNKHEKKALLSNEMYALGYLEGLIEGSWKCYDCGNIYEISVEECPNLKIDQAAADLRGAKYKSEMIA